MLVKINLREAALSVVYLGNEPAKVYDQLGSITITPYASDQERNAFKRSRLMLKLETGTVQATK